jgi:hypothetical protein
MIWVVVAMIGIAGIPSFIMRRIDEYHYVKKKGGSLRWLLLKSRVARTALLSLGIVCCVAVAIVAALPLPEYATRILSIVLLIAAEACMVATLWSDQFWANRIDNAPAQMDARMDAQDRRMDAEDVRMDTIEQVAHGHAGQQGVIHPADHADRHTEEKGE